MSGAATVPNSRNAALRLFKIAAYLERDPVTIS
jgi:hypothetical protein